MRFRCNMPTCGEFPRGHEFEDNGGVCPKCGASGGKMIATLIDVHLMVMDRKGPIQGGEGRQYVACEPKRDHLCRSPMHPWSASDDVLAVTCPKCVRTREYRERAAGIAELLSKLEAPTLTAVDFGSK